MKIVKQRLHLLFTPTKITIKYLIHHILNTTLSKISLKVFYTSIHGFLHHQLFYPSLTQPLDSHMRNMKRQKDYAVHDQSQEQRHYLARVISTR